ncbi:hypothetical protein Tco_0641216 [Tanacetum coccineum]
MIKKLAFEMTWHNISDWQAPPPYHINRPSSSNSNVVTTSSLLQILFLRKRAVIFQVQRSAISEAKREDIRKHGVESSNKNLDGDHEVNLQQGLRMTLASDIDSRTSCPTTRTGPMPVEVTTVAKQAFVELLEEDINIPAWLAFNSEDGVNVVSDDSL